MCEVSIGLMLQSFLLLSVLSNPSSTLRKTLNQISCYFKLLLCTSWFMKDMTAVMSKLENLAEKLDDLSKEVLSGEHLGEPVEELSTFEDTSTEVRVSKPTF